MTRDLSAPAATVTVLPVSAAVAACSGSSADSAGSEKQ